MNYRRSLLLAEKSIVSAGTETIDIRVTEPISRITIAWRVTKAHNHMEAPPAADLTKIELVDGSDVLHSLNGYENQALCIYDRRVETMNHGQHITASSEYSAYGLDFGRYLNDPMLALLPKRFRNPQLKISHNLALSDTSAAAAYLEVWADLFDEKQISPIGFLMAKEHYSYVPGAANSYEYIDLPTDYPLRKLLIRAWRAGYAPWDQVLEAKLDEDNDKRVPFDMDLEDWVRMRKGEDVMLKEQVIGYVQIAGEHVFYVTPTDYYTLVAGLTQGTSPAYLATYGSGGKLDIVCAASAMFNGVAIGWCPNHCFQIPFGMEKDIEDWYDVTKVGSLRLRLKAGSSGASSTGAAVVLQQLRRY